MELPEIIGETFEAIEKSQILLPESFKTIIFSFVETMILSSETTMGIALKTT